MMLRAWTILLLLCAVTGAAVARAGQSPTTRPTRTGAVQPPVVLGASVAGTPGAQPSVPASKGDDSKEILILQALEQPTSLRIEDAPIGEAIRILSEKTGVPIEFDRFVLGCLPYGSKTRVTATIENRPLKESLTALLEPLASKFVVEGDKLIITPRPALFRICRRATWDEVALIEKLYRSPWTKELADSLEFQFQDMSSADADANRNKIYALAASVGAGKAAHVLEYACRQFGWAWHPQGNAVCFNTRARQVDRQLQLTVSAQYSEVQLKDVLLDLVARAGLELKMDPGVLSALPTQQVERFRMEVQNVTVRQALELVAGMTGLSYIVEPDGVRIAATSFSPDAAHNPGREADVAAQTVAAMRSNPIIGEFTIPGEDGVTYSFFLREQDLPPDVNQLRQQHLRYFADRLRNTLSTRPVE